MGDCKTEIIEMANNLENESLLTIRTDRGDEYVINADAAAKEIAGLLSDYENERRFGWTLGLAWWRERLEMIRSAVVCGAPSPPPDTGG